MRKTKAGEKLARNRVDDDVFAGIVAGCCIGAIAVTVIVHMHRDLDTLTAIMLRCAG